VDQTLTLWNTSDDRRADTAAGIFSRFNREFATKNALAGRDRSDRVTEATAHNWARGLVNNLDLSYLSENQA
jgi:hypothetical protein